MKEFGAIFLTAITFASFGMDDGMSRLHRAAGKGCHWKVFRLIRDGEPVDARDRL